MQSAIDEVGRDIHQTQRCRRISTDQADVVCPQQIDESLAAKAFVLDLDGTPDAIALKRLALKQAGGGLDAQGTLKLKPALGWQLTAKASRLDPGAFARQWPGALDFDLASDGTLTDHGPDATFKLERLRGTLRKRPLSGSANLTLKPGYVVDGTLDIASGNSRIDASGRGGDHTDATIKLAIASLGDWLPDAGGRLDGQFRVQGKWPKLAVSGRSGQACASIAARRRSARCWLPSASVAGSRTRNSSPPYRATTSYSRTLELSVAAI